MNTAYRIIGIFDYKRVSRGQNIALYVYCIVPPPYRKQFCQITLFDTIYDVIVNTIRLRMACVHDVTCNNDNTYNYILSVAGECRISLFVLDRL